MELTRTQLLDARAPLCKWSDDELTAALAARFPGTDPINMEALIASWLADGTLSRATLIQCAILARKATGIRAHRPRTKPRKCLTEIAAALAAPPP